MDKDKKKEFQDLQAELKESAHKIWLAGLGALAAAEQEGSKLFRNLVEKGEGYESRGREEFEEAKHKVEDAAQDAKRQADTAWKRVEGRLDEAVTGALGRLGVPSRDEIATLTRRVEELTVVVEQLRDTKAPARKTTAKKTTTSTVAN